MYSVFRNLAIIILSAKFFGLVARKFKAPQVVGEIIAGLIIGPCLLNLVHISDTISIFAEIGVVLLMFSTGLGTNLKELIKAGPIATLIACVGVAVPLAGGTLLYSLFYGFSALGSQEFYRALFIGTIMTATSVSITVATLQELGHLKNLALRMMMARFRKTEYINLPSSVLFHLTGLSAAPDPLFFYYIAAPSQNQNASQFFSLKKQTKFTKASVQIFVRIFGPQGLTK